MPRKKRLIGVASSAGQGAITGGGAGWGTGMLLTNPVKDLNWKRQKIGFVTGSLLGAGIGGYNKYRQNVAKLSKPRKIRTY